MQWIHAVLLLKQIGIVAPWIVTRADNDKPTTQMQNEKKNKSHPNPNLSVSLSQAFIGYILHTKCRRINCNISTFLVQLLGFLFFCRYLQNSKFIVLVFPPAGQLFERSSPSFSWISLCKSSSGGWSGKPGKCGCFIIFVILAEFWL